MHMNPYFFFWSMTKRWTVTILYLHSIRGSVYKVTRRIPELSIAETKVFSRKEDAVLQFQQWLQEC